MLFRRQRAWPALRLQRAWCACIFALALFEGSCAEDLDHAELVLTSWLSSQLHVRPACYLMAQLAHLCADHTLPVCYGAHWLEHSTCIGPDFPRMWSAALQSEENRERSAPAAGHSDGARQGSAHAIAPQAMGPRGGSPDKRQESPNRRCNGAAERGEAPYNMHARPYGEYFLFMHGCLEFLLCPENSSALCNTCLLVCSAGWPC